MPSYDAIGFQPPAPVAQVTVRASATGAAVANVPLLIDSGADVSLLPRELLTELLHKTQNLPQYELEAFDGTKSHAPAAQLELEFLGKKFRGQFLLVEGQYGILGRNILNVLKLVLDGPALTWTESE
jgi:hypothetical protein